MEISVVIMAGGKGERFWPLSRFSRPKQFLPVAHESITMIEETLTRANKITTPDNIFISLRADLVPIARATLPDFPLENLIIEPMPRDTAAAMGLAAVVVERLRPGTVMAVLPSDHLIQPDDVFVKDILGAAKTAYESDCLMTLGIKPTRADTGYGYIHIGELIRNKGGIQAYEVCQFLEKPDIKRAMDFFASPDYFWNAGIFVWKPSVFLTEMERFLPQHHAGMMEIAEFVGDVAFVERAAPIFDNFTKISVDYGIMEKADNVLCMKASFEWDDIGSWTALERLKGKDEHENVLSGTTLALNSSSCEVLNFSKNKIVSVLGVKDLLVVSTDDAIMICDKNSEQDIKKLVQMMGEQKEFRKFLD